VGRIILFEAGASFALSAALAVYVVLLRPRGPLHHVVLAVLTSFMAWTAGLALVYVGGHHPALARAGALTVFTGVMLAPPCWLFLCARLARIPFAMDQPRAALWAMITPSALLLTAAATDFAHGLFANRHTVEIFTTSYTAWAGPLFWVHAFWGYACAVGGVALCLRALRRAPGPVERTRLRLVALAASVPMLSTAITLSGALPRRVPITPADLGVSAVLLVAAILRYRFLEASPLPASQVISHLTDGLVLADAAGEVVEASPAALSLLGRSLDELRGRPLDAVLDALGPLEGGPAREAHSPAVRTLVTADERVVDVSRGQVLDEAGRHAGSFLVLRDRTEQHRHERRRYQSQRLESIGALAAGIAHEINNPLAFVRTNLAQLERACESLQKHAHDLPQDARDELHESQQVLRETHEGVDRIARIVEATRRLSRPASPTLDLVDVNRVALLALDLAQVHARREVTLETDLASGLPAVRGSAEELAQLVLGLLINAVQALRGRRGGRIRLQSRADSAWVELRVHDDGPGVAAERRDQIFDPFYTTRSPEQGTGLGLALAFEIARQHGGTLEVTRSNLGGACFTLKLPVARDAAAGRPAAERDPDHAPAAAIRPMPAREPAAGEGE
jgi:signal transduction histidine kinase